jgi:hypothetical protein
MVQLPFIYHSTPAQHYLNVEIAQARSRNPQIGPMNQILEFIARFRIAAPPGDVSFQSTLGCELDAFCFMGKAKSW